MVKLRANRYGLNIAYNDGTEMFGAASAPDDGPGSLRFFWRNSLPTSAPGDPGHVGVVGPYTFWGYPTRIDNNGVPERVTTEYFWNFENNAHDSRERRFNGPLWRAKDEGVGDAYFGSEVTSPRPPKSQTLPGQTNSSISILEELDAE